MSDIVVKRHDTWPPITATLEQLNESTGKPEVIDLTSAVKVQFLMKSGNRVVEGVAVVTTAKLGKVSYTFAPEDTSVAGEYKVEFEIEWGAGKLQTVPNSGYKTILVEPDLGAA